MLILGLLGMYFDAAVVFVTNSSLFFRLAVAILWTTRITLAKLSLKKENKESMSKLVTRQFEFLKKQKQLTDFDDFWPKNEDLFLVSWVWYFALFTHVGDLVQLKDNVVFELKTKKYFLTDFDNFFHLKWLSNKKCTHSKVIENRNLFIEDFDSRNWLLSLFFLRY